MKPTPEDLAIIRLVQADARMPISRIAARLGVAESTARHRMNRLVDKGMISFVALSDPIKLGYQVWMVLMIQAELQKIRSIAEQLSDAPEVYFVAITNGAHDIQASAVFRSNEEYVEFLTTRMAEMDGIKAVTSYNLLSVVKRRMAIVPPLAGQFITSGT